MSPIRLKSGQGQCCCIVEGDVYVLYKYLKYTGELAVSVWHMDLAPLGLITQGTDHVAYI